MEDAEGPLPGGIATVVRFFMHVPQWIQIGGIILGAVVAVVAVVFIWRSRQQIINWVTTRSRGVKIAIATAAGLVVLAGAASSYVAMDYVNHANEFCTGCHVMGPSYVRFTESEHSDLNCHDCHQQSIFASMRQLYLWVLDRPEEIGPHAPVPNRVCESCHVTGQPEVWQRIASTAGHRTHLESDERELSEVMCVTCHGQEVHQFVPTEQTCGTSGCHDQTMIVLEKMADLPAMHCITCHQFTVEAPFPAPRERVAEVFTPREQQCFSCHEMTEAMATYDIAWDPHKGSCGLCHNPHVDVVARDAAQTCADCHMDWRARPFHVGPSHVRVAEQCILCHQPHAALIDPSDCTGCHAGVAANPEAPRQVRERLQRVLPFDTLRALPRRSPQSMWAHPPEGITISTRDSPVPRSVWAHPDRSNAVLFSASHANFPLPADTFSHDRHRDLSCLTCHTMATGHGRLTFEAPRGCQICHHQAPETSDCSVCHAAQTLEPPRSVRVRVAVAEEPPRERPVDYAHTAHAGLRCVDCHTAPVTLRPPDAVKQCTDCHGDHHTAARTCATCHLTEAIRSAHERPADAHVKCDACHNPETVALLFPDRSFCSTCHQEQAADHYVERECATCHMLATPEEHRRRLVSGSGRR